MLHRPVCFLMPVTAVWAHADPLLVRLRLDEEIIETTPEHPFYTAEGEWVAASALQAGDRLRRADGSYGRVNAVEFVESLQMMYNLTVAEAHTYFVGESRWLVHNMCADGIRGAPSGAGDSGGPTAGKKVKGLLRRAALKINKLVNPRGHYWCTHCQYENTNASHFDVDHIVPKSQGGNLNLKNLRVLCQGCNRSAQEGWPPNPDKFWANRYPDLDMRP